MSIPRDTSLETYVSHLLGSRVRRARTLSGGKMSDVVWMELAGRLPVVVKCVQDLPLMLEARMLRLLREATDLPVPEVLHAENDLLILEAMPGEHIGAAAARHCAGLVARLHGVTGEAFGFGGDTLNGRVVLQSPWAERWVPFWSEHRLRFSRNLATAHRRLPDAMLARIDVVIDATGDLLTEPERPALLHGDLWNANVLAIDDAVTAFLDPSACYGHPEMEIAYVDAFGAFGPEFIEGYQAERPLAVEFWSLRRHVYALYPLLMHAYYFGDRFLPHIERRLDAIEGA